jgi:ribose transport system permease protein
MTSVVERAERSLTLSRVFTSLGPLLALLAVTALFAVLEVLWSDRPPVFLTADNFRLVVVNSATIGICALGMTVVIISGGIDLSVGTGLALCATVLACALVRDMPPALAVGLTLAVGCLLGAVNGVAISGLRVAPFIVTLGTMTVFLGVAKMLAQQVAGADTVRPKTIDAGRPDYVQNQVPEWLKTFTSTRERALWPDANWFPPAVRPAVEWVRFPSGIWLGVGLALLLAALLRFTVFGRYVFALGSNEATARLCGINVPAVRIAVYVLLGCFVGLAGVYQFSRLMSGNPTSGLGQELRVIAAVVIGGGSLSGGRGSILGTLAGAALMSVIASGCTQLGVSNALQDVVLGVIIVAAVTLDQFRQRRFADV